MKPKGQLQILHGFLFFWYLHKGKHVATFSCSPRQQKHVVHTYRNLRLFFSTFPYVLYSFIILTWSLPSSIYEQDITYTCTQSSDLALTIHYSSKTRLYPSLLFSLQPSTTFSYFPSQPFTLSHPSGQANTSCCLYWCKQCQQLKPHTRCYTEKWCFILESQLLKTNMAQFEFLF